jgi:uncharacterized protein (DUF433 family)
MYAQIFCLILSNINSDKKGMYDRITVNPAQMGGVPCIRNLRIPVATIITMIAQGMSEKEILDSYPDLEKEDITQSLEYAAESVREKEIPLRKVG